MLAVSPKPAAYCFSYPSKIIYWTADEASVALRDVAVKHMRCGTYDPRLMPFPCDAHFHLGRAHT